MLIFSFIVLSNKLKPNVSEIEVPNFEEPAAGHLFKLLWAKLDFSVRHTELYKLQIRISYVKFGKPVKSLNQDLGL